MTRNPHAPLLCLISLVAGALSACAAYRPAPLGPAVDAALAGPAGQGGFAIDLQKPLTPKALALIAVVANPDLKAARLAAKVSDAQVFQAGLLPDPVVNLSFDKHLSGPDMFNGFGAQLIYDVMALRSRQVALAAARAARSQVRYDLAWREWQAAGQARLLAARIAGLEPAERLLAEEKALSASALDRTLAAAARGDLKADDITPRRLAALDAADRARQGERDLAAARFDLNALLGLPPATRLTIAPDPSVPGPAAAAGGADEADALFARARASRLDLKALEAGYQSQDAALRKAIWDTFPTLQLTINGARDTANNRTLGPAVNFTLPAWNRNAGGIAIARATREQLRAEYAARLVAVRAQIAQLSHALAMDRARRAELVGQAGSLERLAGRAEAAAKAGDLSEVVAQAARLSADDKALSLLALDQSIAEQTVALTLAAGGEP